MTHGRISPHPGVSGQQPANPRPPLASRTQKHPLDNRNTPDRRQSRLPALFQSALVPVGENGAPYTIAAQTEQDPSFPDRTGNQTGPDRRCGRYTLQTYLSRPTQNPTRALARNPTPSVTPPLYPPVGPNTPAPAHGCLNTDSPPPGPQTSHNSPTGESAEPPQGHDPATLLAQTDISIDSPPPTQPLEIIRPTRRASSNQHPGETLPAVAFHPRPSARKLTTSQPCQAIVPRRAG